MSSFRIWKWAKFALVLSAALQTRAAYAISGLPFDDFLNNPLRFLSEDIAIPTIKILGAVFAHRSYEPATPLGTKLGLDIGVDAALIQVPTSLGNNFAQAGFDIPLPPLLPNLHYLNFHKGLSDHVDVGVSVLSYASYLVWAVDFKYVIAEPEEGPTWAFRLNYTHSHFPIGSFDLTGPAGNFSGNLAIDTNVWTPQLLISKKMEFADPYIGVGCDIINGKMSLNVTELPVTGGGSPSVPYTRSVDGKGYNAFAFLGLSLRIPNLGPRLTLEGAYNQAGYNMLGAKVSINY